MFDTLPLHDATVQQIRFCWQEAVCTLQLSTTEDGERFLVFSGVTDLHIPKEQPWGPSVSINAGRQVGLNRFEIELQSGDVLRVQAKEWKFFEDEPTPNR